MYLLHKIENVRLVYQICRMDYISMRTVWSDLEILKIKAVSKLMGLFKYRIDNCRCWKRVEALAIRSYQSGDGRGTDACSFISQRCNKYWR
jgi:hypothetical protein